jgi:HEAT repeat protein
MSSHKNIILISILTLLLIRPFGIFTLTTGNGMTSAEYDECPVFRTAMLYAAEKGSAREITGIIHEILNETVDAKKQEYVKRLRTYPPEEVGLCWLELLNDAVRVVTTVRVIDHMSEYNDKRFVLPLAKHLISPHYAIRRSAARALKKIGDDRLFPVILNMVNSTNPVHRIYFIEAMNFLYDHRFYQSLTGMLRDDNKSIRIYVLNCLKENKITESLGQIRGSALSDKNDEVRIAAIEAIGAMRDGNSLGTLNITLNDKNRDVRCESAKSISLINSMASVNPLSLRLFVEDDNEIKELMIETLATLRRTGDVRGLEKIMLTDGNLGLRVKAAYVLGYSGSLQAFTALQKALFDSDFRVRAEVCNSLGNYRNRQSLASLFDVLEREEPVYVKSAALYSIKRINDKSSLMGLFDLFTRENDPIFREMLRNSINEYIKRYI